MPAWVIWMVLAALLGVGEIFTLSLVLGPLAIAAAAGGLAAALGAGLVLQFVAFIVAALASLALLRPVARRHLRAPARLRTGSAALVGSTATVVERVDADGGMVRLAGEVWTARPYDETVVIEPGAKVEVLQIQGATALVSE